MIVLKTTKELEAMREACRLSALALQVGLEAVKPGVTTWDIDRKIHDFITSHGAKPSFLGYGGFPGSACISINEQVIHGIPSKKTVIREGDIVSIDVGAFYKGYHGDNAGTVGAGEIDPQVRQLLEVTEKSLYDGIAAAVAGNRIGDISAAVEARANRYGYGVVREYVGHGVGANLHEDPEVPNYGRAGHGPRLTCGMTRAIEPMINLGTEMVKVLKDGWTVVTADGKPAAHFEHTIAITDNGLVILTKP